MSESFLNGRITLHCGDSREVLKTIPENSIDCCVCDPPYSLVSIIKRFGSGAPVKSDGVYRRASSGFMGKTWDTGETAFDPEFWVEVLRVLKPGAHLVAFGGTRTYHRLACAIEDAGFEVRDCLSWLFGQGFPKSHNVTRNLNDEICLCETLPECDLRSLRNDDVSPSIRISKECSEILFDSVSKQGLQNSMSWSEPTKGSQGREQPSLEGRGHLSESSRQLRQRKICSVSTRTVGDVTTGRLCDGASFSDGALDKTSTNTHRMRSSSGSQTSKQCENESRIMAMQQKPQISGTWDHCRRCNKPMVPNGLGTALKPAMELIILARKPLSESTIATNVLKWTTGALNIDGARIGARTESTGEIVSENVAMSGSNYGRKETGETTIGRWPANIIHDGSSEVVEMFPSEAGGSSGVVGSHNQHDDSGSAARFFYSAKADSDDRLGSRHPTVKPLDLMQYLIRLVCPPKGVVLDPFSGTGTTGEAAFREGMGAVLIEREAEYQADIRRRMGMVMAGSDERSREAIRARGLLNTDPGPLFGGLAESRGGGRQIYGVYADEKLPRR